MSQLKLVQTETALNNIFKNFEANGLDNVDLKTYLEMVASLVEKQLKEELKKEKSFKVEMAVAVNLARRSDDKIVSVKPYFRSGIQHFNSSTIIPETFETMKQKIIESFATYTSGGSGWIFQSIEKFLLNVDKNIPLNGSSYIDLPKEMKTKKAIINVKNKENRCFEYAILSAQHHSEIDQKQANSPSQYKEHLDKLNCTGIDFPVSLKDIDKFEKKIILKSVSTCFVLKKVFTS